MSHFSRPTSFQEAIQPVIPRKRNAEVALIELSDSDSDAPRPKKPRLDLQQKHPLLAVNRNLPPYITAQPTMVIPDLPVMTVRAASPGPVMPQPTPMPEPFLPQGPVQSIDEILDERTRIANALSQLRASLTTRPEIDRDLVNDHINSWQLSLSVIDNKIAEIQRAATTEGPAVVPNPHPPFLMTPSPGYLSVTPELAPPETIYDAYPMHVESEGEASNAENGQPNGNPPLPMSNHAISTVASSQPAKYAGATECLQYTLIFHIVYRNSFRTATETFLTLMLPFKKVSKSSDCVI